MIGILQLTSPQVCLIVSVLSSYTLKTGTPIEDGDSILKLLRCNKGWILYSELKGNYILKKLCKIKFNLNLFYQALSLCNYTKVVWL